MIDTNKDNKISSTELVNMMKEFGEDIDAQDVQDVFEQFGDPDTGMITYQQYEKMIYSNQ